MTGPLVMTQSEVMTGTTLIEIPDMQIFCNLLMLSSRQGVLG
jgi:hypothetical protein